LTCSQTHVASEMGDTARLIPMPTRAWPPTASISNPAIFLPSTIRSFGHLISASTPFRCNVSATASAARADSRSTAGTISVAYIPPIGEHQFRPHRPRPAVCVLAMTRSGQGRGSISNRATSWVDVTESNSTILGASDALIPLIVRHRGAAQDPSAHAASSLLIERLRVEPARAKRYDR